MINFVSKRTLLNMFYVQAVYLRAWLKGKGPQGQGGCGCIAEINLYIESHFFSQNFNSSIVNYYAHRTLLLSVTIIHLIHIFFLKINVQ